MKRKIFLLPVDMVSGMKTFCRDNKIDSEAELVRAAIAHYLDRSYSEETLKMQGVHALINKVETLSDMLDAMFKYIYKMHTNILGYLPEIDAELKDAAYKSAAFRHEKFFNVFQNSLKQDPPFFEKLLSRFYTEEK